MEDNRAVALKKRNAGNKLTEEQRRAEDKKQREERIKQMEQNKQDMFIKLGS
jgi:hypothetical protein